MTEFYITIAVLVVLTIVGLNLGIVFTKVVTVWEHELVLHYRHGVLVGRLTPGRHRLWGRGHAVTPLDGRLQEAVIQGQEFLTADKAPVKVSGIVRYRIAELLKELERK